MRKPEKNRLRRTMMFMSAQKPALVKDAYIFGADSVILDLEDAVADIVAQLQNRLEREVASAQVGELCMEKLRGIDQVAYVRFASVYRQFQDIDSFMEELSKLLAEQNQR